MRKDVKKLVKECQIFQVNKHEASMPARLLQPLPIPQQPWLDISMGFIDGLPLSNRMSMVLIVVGRLTKFSHFFAISILT